MENPKPNKSKTIKLIANIVIVAAVLIGVTFTLYIIASNSEMNTKQSSVASDSLSQSEPKTSVEVQANTMQLLNTYSSCNDADLYNTGTESQKTECSDAKSTVDNADCSSVNLEDRSIFVQGTEPANSSDFNPELEQLYYICYAKELRRSTDDTQRKDALSRLQAAISNYTANNRGVSPFVSTPEGTTQNFIDTYLRANGETFADPSGVYYTIVEAISEADKAGDGKIAVASGGKCSDGDYPSAGSPVEGARFGALRIKLESGSIHCLDY